jgi:hypothetical protein
MHSPLPLQFQFCLEQKLHLQVLALWATNTYLGISYHYLPTGEPDDARQHPFWAVRKAEQTA